MEIALAKRILKNRKVVEVGGKYELKVSNVNNDYTKVHDGGVQIGIINFNAWSMSQAVEAKAMIKQGDYQEACNNQLTCGIFEDSSNFHPSKGDTVTVIIKEGKPEYGGISVAKIIEIQAKEASVISVESLFGEEEDQRVQIIEGQAVDTQTGEMVESYGK